MPKKEDKQDLKLAEQEVAEETTHKVEELVG